MHAAAIEAVNKRPSYTSSKKNLVVAMKTVAAVLFAVNDSFKLHTWASFATALVVYVYALLGPDRFRRKEKRHGKLKNEFN